MDYEILFQFLLAALWGGIVGAEREYHSKSAGFRTMIMISIGSCFFTIMSTQIGLPGSTDRIASNIVTGIGFLGAGVIFRGENRINGITTAATIWAVAAVGMGIGSGNYYAAAYASLLILLVLALLPYIEQFIDRLNQSRIYTIKCSFSPSAVQTIEQTFQRHHLKFKLANQLKEEDMLTLKWETFGLEKYHKEFISEMTNDEKIVKFEF
ncbi:MAG: MgtC/SapB family protein [Lacibacter sp.]